MGIKTSSINIRNVEFISGIKLEEIKSEAYSNSRGLPTVGYGEILDTIESNLQNYNPTQLLPQQIKKYTKESNLYLVEVGDVYKFRPDLISYIFYGSVEYYQIILSLNGMKSFLEFIPNNTNNLIFIFKRNVIDIILGQK